MTNADFDQAMAGVCYRHGYTYMGNIVHQGSIQIDVQVRANLEEDRLDLHALKHLIHNVMPFPYIPQLIEV